jgi:hypothetical protein
VVASTEARERQAVVDVALDYFEGWFTADADRMRRALHPGLAKRRLADDERGLAESTATGMVEATAAGEALRRGDDPGEILVEVLELYDRIATVVVRSNVFREYLHLAHTSDGWKIVNALWAWTDLTRNTESGQLT